MSTLAIAYDSTVDSAEAQLAEKERAFAERARAVQKRVHSRPEVASIFARVDIARSEALAAREDALMRGELALKVTERRLAELEQEQKKAVALVREHAPRVAMESELDRDEDVQLFTGFAGDVAHGGVFVPTVAAMEVGTQVDLQLRLPERTVRVRGEVRWIRDECKGMQGGLGIGFVAVEATDLAFFTALDTEPMFYPD